MIKPDTPIKPLWDLLIFILLLEQCLMIPFQMCFEVMEFQDLQGDDISRYLQLSIDIIFAVDIYINFISGIYYQGSVVLNKSKIATIYFKSW